MFSNLEMTGPLGAGCSEATGALGKKPIGKLCLACRFLLFVSFLGSVKIPTHMSYVYIILYNIYLFMILFMYIYIHSL